MDLYRSQTVSLKQARAAAGPLLDSYLKVRLENRPSAAKALPRLKAQIEERILGLGSLAFVALNLNEYIISSERMAYLTFDLVDKADEKTRMPFSPAPTGHPADPGGALAAWRSYADLGESLSKKGVLDMSERHGCPGFYCLWGSSTSELSALEKRIAGAATPHHKELLHVLTTEADPKKRAAAVYVLSYLADGSAVVKAAQQALLDSAEEVRAAALQVLSDVATYHKRVLIDPSRVIAALDYPTVSDRAKALSVLVGLADNPTTKHYVATRATPYLLGLLKLKQPSNHELAFTLLATISQENYTRSDLDSWQKWVQTKSSSGSVVVPGVMTEDAR